MRGIQRISRRNMIEIRREMEEKKIETYLSQSENPPLLAHK